ncbi:hypothetical protein [Dyadobacter arcticus]|uniref:Uncharacterized protein n=1 Tax=Dyadobacter arcticus TaxID=1078754 RepID=A0ABX0UEB6_9BACT|nr:hypothetical protein [Dyadobacter arcticus]NIJ50878.1 hypothetical protein [Dyadobacter arcticus]
MSLSWKSNFISTEFRIFRGKVIAGILRTSSWKNEGYGELDGNLLRFKTKGFLQKITEIRDIEGEKVLGQIQFHFMSSSATITYDHIDYNWKFASWSMRKWNVSNGNAHAAFKKTGFWQKEGEIEDQEIPPAVILASLYAHIHFRKVAAAA